MIKSLCEIKTLFSQRLLSSPVWDISCIINEVRVIFFIEWTRKISQTRVFDQFYVFILKKLMEEGS